MNLEQLQAKYEAKHQEFLEMKGVLEAKEDKTEVELKSFEDLMNEVESTERELELAKKSASLSRPVNFVPIEEKNMNPFQLAIKEAYSKINQEVKATGIELKTTATTSAGLKGETSSLGVVYGGVSPGYALLDAVPIVPLTSINQTFYRSNTRTNNAAATADGTAPTDNVNTFDAVDVTAKQLTSWIPASEGMLLSGDPRAIAQFENEVVQFLKERLDNEMIDGSVLNSISGLTGITTGAVSSGLYREGIYGAAMEVEANGDYANILLVNPSDWNLIINQKDDNNAYVFNMAQHDGTYFGLRVVRDANVTAGTAFVLGRDGVKLGVMGDWTLKFGYNASDFSAGRITLRAMCFANTILRPKSIYKLTL